MKAFSSHLKTAGIYFSIPHCRNDPNKYFANKKAMQTHVNRGSCMACMKNHYDIFFRKFKN